MRLAGVSSELSATDRFTLFATANKQNDDMRCLKALRVGYYRRMGARVYAIDAFPDDDSLWRIDWIGGVEHNMDAPSDPLIKVCRVDGA
jgi:hypothetical protein